LQPYFDEVNFGRSRKHYQNHPNMVDNINFDYRDWYESPNERIDELINYYSKVGKQEKDYNFSPMLHSFYKKVSEDPEGHNKYSTKVRKTISPMKLAAQLRMDEESKNVERYLLNNERSNQTIDDAILCEQIDKKGKTSSKKVMLPNLNLLADGKLKMKTIEISSGRGLNRNGNTVVKNNGSNIVKSLSPAYSPKNGLVRNLRKDNSVKTISRRIN
jgi:hypothetical protein